MRVSEGGVCKENDKGNISPGNTEYVLMNINRTSCDVDDKFI